MPSGRLLGEDVLGISNREKARDTLETLCVSAGLGVPQEEDKAVVWGGRKLSRWMNTSTSLYIHQSRWHYSPGERSIINVYVLLSVTGACLTWGVDVGFLLFSDDDAFT